MSDYKRLPSGQIEIPDVALDILAYVEDYHDAHGYGPSFREICDATSAGSTSVVAKHVRKLAALKIIDWTPKVARSVRPASDDTRQAAVEQVQTAVERLTEDAQELRCSLRTLIASIDLRV